MEHNVLIISSAETFSVRGLEMKLNGIGMTSGYSGVKINDLKTKLETADLIVLYTDPEINSVTDTIVFIKDHCVEKDGKVMVIGSKDEYESVKKIIPHEYVAGYFDRPLEMDKFLTEVEIFFSKVQERRKSILIVDDNVTYMSMVMDWLKDTYRVSMANSGMQAIKWLVNNHADLILLDYEMPVTTGPKVLEMIRSQGEMADIPVIFLTAVGDKESIMKVLSLKPADYLLKTIDKKGLLDKLDEFFRNRK